MAKITPALTPEEWRMAHGGHAAPHTQTISRDEWGSWQIYVPGMICAGHPYEAPELSEYPSQRHALAALLLHEQPFGFTHGDVANLRHVGQSPACGPLRGGALLDLADRIAALLPPEEEQ